MTHRAGHVPPVLAPGEYPRRVLLAVSGLSPQIVTETLYALAVAAPADERFVPTEVHVLTTTEGARRVRQSLLSEQPGGFHALRRDYDLPPITLGDAQIHLVSGPDGVPLPDIRSEADNALMADAITDLVRALTADPASALHVSMAGGRKTMGYYAGYALSLFGRAQDRLSHVLVSAPFESSFEFYYPTPQSRIIPVQGGAQADAATATVSLAQIPFVRLRHVLPADMLQQRAGFAAAVQAADQRLGPPRLVIDVPARSIEADGQRIRLAPWQFALMALLAHRAMTAQPALRMPTHDAHDTAWSEEVLRNLLAAFGSLSEVESVANSLRTLTSEQTEIWRRSRKPLPEASSRRLSPHLSRLRNVLNEALGPGRAVLYLADGADRKNRCYCVPLPAADITWRR
ncbi:MAG: hypothetical protein RLY71_1626 [Pseudomonadota bacterium]